jgi:hypothetical protein
MKLPGVTQIKFGLDKRDDHLRYWKERKEIIVKLFQHSFFFVGMRTGQGIVTAQYWYRGGKILSTFLKPKFFLDCWYTLSQNYHVKTKVKAVQKIVKIIWVCQDFQDFSIVLVESIESRLKHVGTKVEKKYWLQYWRF